MPNHNTNQSTSMAAAPGRTQKPVIPTVRYHPSIQTQTQTTLGGARAKTRTSKTQKTRPVPEQAPQSDTQTDQENRDAHNSHHVDPVPAVRPGPDGGLKRDAQTAVRKPNQKPVRGTATNPDPPQTPDHPSDREPLTPEKVPLGLGAQLDRRTVEQVEVLTRGQSTNETWFSWRKNRITASVADRITRCRFVNNKAQTPPASLVAAVTGETKRVQTRAMSWGVEKEAEVVRQYQRLKTSLDRPVLVLGCGLFIDPQRPWLAASPDGIVTDRRTGQWLLVLEVKCPFKHRHRRVEDACRDDPAFCLEIQEDGRKPGGAPVYRLKRSHSYFTQIQCQLAVTGLQQADLAVFTLKETAIVPVTFDPVLWEETVSKLEVFYRDAVLPRLRERRGPAAAWTPEL